LNYTRTIYHHLEHSQATI